MAIMVNKIVALRWDANHFDRDFNWGCIPNSYASYVCDWKYEIRTYLILVLFL